nr:MAG TPA: hypothetical protein [Caudoviricetes sp.]
MVGSGTFYQLSKPMSRKNFHPCLLIFDFNALLVYKNDFQFDFHFHFGFHFQNQIHLEKVLAASENL